MDQQVSSLFIIQKDVALFNLKFLYREGCRC